MVEYKRGNLLTSGCDIICHQVNCQGVMGSGIAKTIKETFPKVYRVFKNSYRNGDAKLGSIDIVIVTNDTEAKQHEFAPISVVVNFYSQYNYLPRGVNHTDYEAFKTCIKKLKTYIQTILPMSIRIGFPDHIGCGLAGGNWNIIKQILEDEFSSSEYKVEIWKLA